MEHNRVKTPVNHDAQTSMRYGNTFDGLKNGMISVAIMGTVFALIIAAFLVFHEHKRIADVAIIFLLPILLDTVFCLVILPTLCFSIHLRGNVVEHRFLDRWVLSSANIHDFQKMTIAEKGWGAILTFASGKQIRFIGAHVGILLQLEEDLGRMRDKAHRQMSRQNAQSSR